MDSIFISMQEHPKGNRCVINKISSVRVKNKRTIEAKALRLKSNMLSMTLSDREDRIMQVLHANQYDIVLYIHTALPEISAIFLKSVVVLEFSLKGGIEFARFVFGGGGKYLLPKIADFCQFVFWWVGSSIVSPICQEGQSETTFRIFAFSYRFFLFFFLIFPLSFLIFPDFVPSSQFLAHFFFFFAVNGALCPPCPHTGYATNGGQ